MPNFDARFGSNTLQASHTERACCFCHDATSLFWCYFKARTHSLLAADDTNGSASSATKSALKAKKIGSHFARALWDAWFRHYARRGRTYAYHASSFHLPLHSEPLLKTLSRQSRASAWWWGQHFDFASLWYSRAAMMRDWCIYFTHRRAFRFAARRAISPLRGRISRRVEMRKRRWWRWSMKPHCLTQHAISNIFAAAYFAATTSPGYYLIVDFLHS